MTDDARIDRLYARFENALEKAQERFDDVVSRVEVRFEKAVEKLQDRDESRDDEVSELKLRVGLLREECRRNMKRDAALVSAPTVLVTAVVAIAQHLTASPVPSAQASAPSQPAARCGDAIVQASEQCDDGVNDGRPGRCLPGCQGWGRVTP